MFRIRFIVFISIFLSLCASSAGPGDGPIVPWPTATLMESPEKSAMIGSWVAFEDNSIWFIDIYEDPDLDYLFDIKIFSHALYGHHGYGRLQFDKRAFWGTLYMADDHDLMVFVYRAHDDTPMMRIGKHNKWHDVELFRYEEHD